MLQTQKLSDFQLTQNSYRKNEAKSLNVKLFRENDPDSEKIYCQNFVKRRERKSMDIQTKCLDEMSRREKCCGWA